MQDRAAQLTYCFLLPTECLLLATYHLLLTTHYLLLQDPAAQLVGLLAAPQAGQTVLELC